MQSRSTSLDASTLAAKNTRPRYVGFCLSLITLLVAACSLNRVPSVPATDETGAGFCAEMGGSWDQESTVCALTGTNARHISVEVTARYPADLLGDPTVGPPIKEFLTGFFTRFRHPDDHLIRNGRAKLTYQRFEHGSSVQSVVFSVFWDLGGASGNNEIDTFTFDLQQHKILSLADLFCVGVDPLTALPPIVRSYVQRAIGPNENIAWWEPGPTMNNSDDYRAWYLDGPDLVLVLPAARSGPFVGGVFQPHVPLSALHSVLRGGACST